MSDRGKASETGGGTMEEEVERVESFNGSEFCGGGGGGGGGGGAVEMEVEEGLRCCTAILWGVDL